LVSQTLKNQASKKTDAISLEDFAAEVERRRARTGITTVPRNSGTRRTDSKKALLEAIKTTGKKW
jgi:hypothetical protein